MKGVNISERTFSPPYWVLFAFIETYSDLISITERAPKPLKYIPVVCYQPQTYFPKELFFLIISCNSNTQSSVGKYEYIHTVLIMIGNNMILVLPAYFCLSQHALHNPDTPVWVAVHQRTCLNSEHVQMDDFIIADMTRKKGLAVWFSNNDIVSLTSLNSVWTSYHGKLKTELKKNDVTVYLVNLIWLGECPKAF